MTERFATTPFGGARFGASSFLRREAIEARRAALKEGGNDTGRADKWQLIRALCEARAAFGLSDRAITVLEALLSFHPERELDGTAPVVVFPSNAELSLRSRGMADATLRRHIAALVEAGLILRRDSPNGKRYCRRDAQGAVESAFGFDLSPLALAAGGIHQAAEEARTEARACRTLRGEITIHLRDAARIIEAGLAERRAGDWEGFSLRLMPLARRLPRQVARVALEERRELLARLRAEVESAYLDALSEQEMSGNDAGFERQYQNSKPDHHFENSSEKELKPAGEPQGETRGWPKGRKNRKGRERQPGKRAAARPKPGPSRWRCPICFRCAPHSRAMRAMASPAGATSSSPPGWCARCWAYRRMRGRNAARRWAISPPPPSSPPSSSGPTRSGRRAAICGR